MAHGAHVRATGQIPEPRRHSVRYGACSNRATGQRRKVEHLPGHAVIAALGRETIKGMASSDLSPVEKLGLALDLFESGVDVMRHNLYRKYPSETRDQIEERLLEWLRTRPGAEHGDAVGRPRAPRGPL